MLLLFEIFFFIIKVIEAIFKATTKNNLILPIIGDRTTPSKVLVKLVPPPTLYVKTFYLDILLIHEILQLS